MIELDNSRRLGTGTWLSTGSPVVAELAAECGFDWLLMDMEHGCLTEAGLLANLQAAKREGIKLIVRIGHMDHALIARVLDWGASGIMLPHVSSAEQAEACVKAMNYPPIGSRGYSGSARAFRYGLNEQTGTHTAPLFIPQIEDYHGVVNAKYIAEIQGVDILFVGPADLKLALSTSNNLPAISYIDALTSVNQAAKMHGKQTGILVRNPDDMPFLRKIGFTCVAIGSDIGFLKAGFLKALREH